MKSIPGWTIKIDEVSNGVIKLILTDAFGHKVEVIDNATNETIQRTIGDAFEIEKLISKNWNKFLFDLCIQELDEIDLTKKEYNDKVFGSWFIEQKDHRMIYDGKDSWLIFQTKQHNGWTDNEIVKKNELKYLNYIGLINNLIK